MNEQNRNRLIDAENKLMVAWGREIGELDEKGKRIKKYKSAVTKQ